MRSVALLTTLLTFTLTTQAGEPYLNALTPKENPLVKRQGCASGYTACNALGAPGSCCPNNTVCSRDQNGNVACCPTNAVCTGVISGTASRSSSTQPALGGTTSSAAGAQATYSTLQNVPYPFIHIPTTYANQQQCLSAYTACQSASTACFNSLAGINGVTVSGIGSYGVTQTGATATLAVESASQICSGLSVTGCYNIQSGQCAQFGTAGATATTGFVQANAGPPATVRCQGAFYTAAAAAFAGAGMVNIVLP